VHYGVGVAPGGEDGDGRAGPTAPPNVQRTVRHAAGTPPGGTGHRCTADRAPTRVRAAAPPCRTDRQGNSGTPAFRRATDHRRRGARRCAPPAQPSPTPRL